MTTRNISLNTKAMLLLCASFGQKRTVEPKPLTLGEYNDLASWLRDHSLTPEDLLDQTVQQKIAQLQINKLESSRLLALLARGMMLSLALEKWTNQGLWILGRGDQDYPKRLKYNLKYQAPVILYGMGNKKLLSEAGLAIVGSRNVDELGLDYTSKLAQACAQQQIQVISGGAKGVDQASMLSVLDKGGMSIGIVANSLAKAAVAKKYRTAIKEGRLALISSYDPDAGFSVGNAMGRNKYIYALANYAVVINATENKGGTWAGAIEALKKVKNVSVLVRIEQDTSKGNQSLIEKGAIPFPQPPWNYPLEKQILEAISKFSVPQRSEVIIEQPSLLDIDNTNADQTVLQSNEPKELINKYDQQSSLTKYEPQDIYQAVLPLILQQLQQPQNDKILAESLEVQIGQLRLWLKRAVKEGKVKKNKNPVTYEISDKRLLF
ncbi:MAG: DNA-processing protein DprA [Cyanobacteria bacterium P01_G01_bin.39]